MFLISSAVALSDRKSTRLNSSHVSISYAVFCLKKIMNYHGVRGVGGGDLDRHFSCISELDGVAGKIEKDLSKRLLITMGGRNVGPYVHLEIELLFFFFLFVRRPPISTLFPYTTLFR